MARLDPEQERLLSRMVEATRNVPSSERQPITVFQGERGGVMHHPGVPPGEKDISLEDIALLERYGLILQTSSSNSGLIRCMVITPEGKEYYSRLRAEDPAVQTEEEILGYLDSDRFRSQHQAAYDHWSRAMRSLGNGDTDEQYTEIGHHCRLAMQEFSDSLLALYPNKGAPSDKTRTIDRLRAVFAPRRDSVSKSVLEVLDALIVYWGAVSDLAQRQEHGAHKEGEALLWHDAQRLVFLTGVVMFEIAQEMSMA